MPQVSVIMAVYNGMPYLPQAIHSILEQTFTDFEFIVVNDCSKDETLEILNSYSDPRLRIINLTQNIGQTAALNRGLQAATAPLLARQDADDLSKPDRLSRQVEFFSQNPEHLLLGTAADLIDNKNRVSGQVVHAASDAELRAILETDNAFFHGAVMFRREVLEKVGFYREGFRNSQDFDYWLRISEAGKVANLAESHYQYRLHEGQMTFTSYYRMKAEWQLALELARLRAQGQDDLSAYEQGAIQLKERFANFTPTASEQRRAMAELWRGKGVSYMNSRRYLPMSYCLLRAFLYEPNNPDLWRGIRNHSPKFS